MTNKKLDCVILILILFTVIGSIVCGILFPDEDLSFNNEDAVVWSDGWQYVNEGDVSSGFNFNEKLDVPTYTEYTITNTLPKNMCEGFSICVRTSFQSLVVKVNGKILYTTGNDTSKYIGSSAGSYWNIIRIPDNYAGQKISLTLCSNYLSFTGRVNPVLYGSKPAIMYKIIESYGVGFIISTIILIFGILILITYFILRRLDERIKSIRFLASFAIWISLWLLCESRMLQFFIGNHFFITNMAFVALAIAPIPLIMYIANYCEFKGRALMHTSLTLLILNAVFNFIFQLLNVYDFFSYSIVTILVIIVVMLLTIISFAVEIFKYKNKAAFKMFLAVLMIIVFATMEVINYLRRDFLLTSQYLKIGLFVFILILSIFSIQSVKKILTVNRESRVYEKLAFFDVMTSSPNRTAFYRDIKEIFARTDKKRDEIALVIFDINGLKKINDHFGHLSGDRAICDCYDCISQSFGKIGTGYRIGGDEFASIIGDYDEEKINAACDIFRKMEAEKAKISEFPFSIAIGYSKINRQTDLNFEDFYNRVDQCMYENKREMKAVLQQL